MRAFTICSLVALASFSPAAESPFPSIPAVPAAKAHRSFHVLDGFEMQLIAAEPLVTDPVAITYDEDGRAYVCEMTDYPYTDKARHKASQENPTDLPIGKVRLLEDTNGDGAYDKSTIFAEGLSWPTGAACWKGGVFVAATPDIWYLKDTDGDGKADVREKVYTGFRKLNIQAVMNNPQWGLDHRIYVAGGSNGANITRPEVASFKPVAIRRNDVSFDPASRELRIESGGARYGNSFDDWGNRFLCNIRNPCQHIALPYERIARNPYLTLTSALQDCAEAGDQLPVYRTSPPEPWRDFRAQRWSAQGSTLPKSELVGAGVVTSSSGITVYRGDAYPEAYRQFAFVNDVAGNLFYRMKLEPDGLTFKAVQVDGAKNFCTSDDIWFRPVNFANAPDGCLHICDMYREVIEHPWSIPDDIHANLDLLQGADKGRLWRLQPKGFAPRRIPKLSQATPAELVALLDHPNAWHRETAHRLLFEKQDRSAITTLQSLVGQAQTPQGKIHALWSLQGLGGVNDAALTTALEDANPEVRAQAMSLGEGRWTKLVSKAALMQQAQEAAPAVQRQVAFQIADLLPALDDASWSQIVQRSESDAWLESALLTLPPEAAPMALMWTLGTGQKNGHLAQRLAAIAAQAAQTPAQIATLLDLVGGAETSPALIIGLDEGLRRQRKTLREMATASAVQSALNQQAIQAAQDSHNRQLAEELRLQALALLRATATAEVLAQTAPALMKPDQPPALQLAALEAAVTARTPDITTLLLSTWKSMSPALRDKALAALMAYPERLAALLEAVEAKTIPAAQISPAARAQLAKNKDPQIVARAAKLFASTGSNRADIIARYQKTMLAEGRSAERGEKVYQLACLACHKHGRQGQDIGPHLGTVQGWTAELLLTNILDPNREVSPNFALYIVEMQDGRILSGLLTSESASSLSFKRADGGVESISRQDIKTLTSTGTSLMPEGLEAAITPQQMADLLTFLTTPIQPLTGGQSAK